MRGLVVVIAAAAFSLLSPVTQAHGNCRECGRIVRMEVSREHGRNTGTGAVAGAVIGGVLGNQVGKGDGRKVATVAGAVAGGVVGNNVEKRKRGGKTTYDITVRMNDGRVVSTHQSHSDGLYQGMDVRIVNGDAEPY